MKTCRIWIMLLIPLLLFPAGCQAEERTDGTVRQPAVAGRFYPDSGPELRLAVEKYMQDALPPAKDPVAIVVPTPATSSRGRSAPTVQPGPRPPIRDRRHPGDEPHEFSFRKVGIYPGRGFQTPLGTAAIDSPSSRPPGGMPGLHARQIDPRQRTLRRGHRSLRAGSLPGRENRPGHRGRGGFGTCERFGKALAKTLKGRNALIVASTDLSHYPSAANASMVDRQTLQAILPLDPASFHAVAHTASDRNIRGLSTRACGERPSWRPWLPPGPRSLGRRPGELRPLGDTVLGERAQVVGYGAVALASGKTGAGDPNRPRCQPAAKAHP